MLFFDINWKMIFQLIKIISEFYYALIKSLARIYISLLIFGLKIEIVIENILKIRYIKFPIDDNILPIIYIFFTFSHIGWNPVEINFNKINSGSLRNIITAIIIKSIIILPFINSEILKIYIRIIIKFAAATKTIHLAFANNIDKSFRSAFYIQEMRLNRRNKLNIIFLYKWW
jgi:hypothetical protein